MKKYAFLLVLAGGFAGCVKENPFKENLAGQWKAISIKDSNGNETINSEPALTHVVWTFDQQGNFSNTSDEGTVTSTYTVENDNTLIFYYNQQQLLFSISFQDEGNTLVVVSEDDPVYREARFEKLP